MQLQFWRYYTNRNSEKIIEFCILPTRVCYNLSNLCPPQCLFVHKILEKCAKKNVYFFNVLIIYVFVLSNLTLHGLYLSQSNLCLCVATNSVSAFVSRTMQLLLGVWKSKNVLCFIDIYSV